MGLLLSAVRAIKRANERFALKFGTILSWPVWLPLILSGSVFGWVFRQNDLVMLLLTIQTSVDAAATKMLQNHVREKDEGREQRNDALLLELQRQSRRAAKHDKLMISAITATNDLLEHIIVKGYAHGRRGPAATQSRRRTNRKK